LHRRRSPRILAIVRRVLVLVLALTAAGACRRSGDDVPAPHVPACAPPVGWFSGEATFYPATGGGSCSFERGGDPLVAAINGADYQHAAWCGACLVVSGPESEIIVRVVDKCPGCKPGDLDLSREAFALLAPLDTGRIPIRWLPVPCDVDGPIAYQFKDGSNPQWTGIQLRNHRYPIQRLEVRDPAGAYVGVTRADYNYFVAPKGLGAGPYAVRVTDTRGHMLEDQIALGDAVARAGQAQFPRCQ
jgi:expansin (peptidoglycan-binding protein)